MEVMVMLIKGSQNKGEAYLKAKAIHKIKITEKKSANEKARFEVKVSMEISTR